jgi:hypothetical protein
MAGDAAERNMDRRRAEENGIAVDDPKVYDDSLLHQMLRAAEAKLAATQVIDQAGISSRIGALSGATQRISSLGINVQGAAVPGLTTTNKGATGSTVTTNTDSVSVDGKPSSSDVVAKTEGLSSQDVVTTAPSFAPPALLSGPAATALPTGFSVSASDALNEQMQLTYEIANLRLLLEGALSDHVTLVDGATYVKPRTTLGFQVSIDPQKRFKNAVAVIEVEVRAVKPLAGQRTSITALLPRDKTYNVAAITDSSTSIGAGVATGVVGVSGSWLRGHKTYYVTQDQDTVAMTFAPDTAGDVGFRWQFRPVLGKEVVRAGLKQTFVQLSLPQLPDEDDVAEVTMRTYWVKYDGKKGTLGKLVPGSLQVYAPRVVARPRLAVSPQQFDNDSLTDLGDGEMLVNLKGRFLTGTYVRLGSAIIREGTPGTLFEHYAIKFSAPIADLATKDLAVVARDGREERVTMSGPPFFTAKAVSATVRGLDDTNVILQVTLDRDPGRILPRPVLVVGGRVFGYSDAPVKISGTSVTAVVPAALVLANPEVTVTQVFGTHSTTVAITNLHERNRAERLVQLDQDTAKSRFLLYGARLQNLVVVEPASGVAVGDLGAQDKDWLRVLTIESARLKSHKLLVLQRPGERPFQLAMPGAAKAPAVKAKERVVVGAAVALFEADSNEGLTKVVCQKEDIVFEKLGDGKTIRLSGLHSKGITTALTTQTCEFTFDAGKASATMEIVNNRVESVAK